MPFISNKPCEDIQCERKKCIFRVQELINFWDGGIEKTEERKALGNYITNFFDEYKPNINSRVLF